MDLRKENVDRERRERKTESGWGGGGALGNGGGVVNEPQTCGQYLAWAEDTIHPVWTLALSWVTGGRLTS